MSAIKVCILLLLLTQLATTLPKATALDSEGEAVSAISTAEDVMVSAYQAVKEAEITGADVSGFSELLKDAAQLLAYANTSFRVGDFDGAVRFANLSSEIGKDVEVKAHQLETRRHGSSVWQIYLTVVKSLFAVLVVVLTSILSWSIFKRLYYRRKRVMKPEVASDGS